MASELTSVERRKRKRERIAIVVLILISIALFFVELRLFRLSSTLPLVSSIFFFGLLNLNIVILIALLWLMFRNLGKVFLERRSPYLGTRLKTKLVVAFLSFAIIPTLMLFLISSTYINSSFDKWFSIKVQNTLQTSLEITRTYYRNADRNALHFADHLAAQLGKRLPANFSSLTAEEREALLPQVRTYLSDQRELLALHAAEFYWDPLDERVIAFSLNAPEAPPAYPRLSVDLLDQALGGERVSVIQHVRSGDLIRCVVPVRKEGRILGVIAVDTYIPVSLVDKVDEIAGVFDDYKKTNPLQYPIKTAYFILLLMITLVILIVATWFGLYLARELTVPLERLMEGARLVGEGKLEVQVEASGRDEIAVLIDSFNKMIRDLRDNRERLVLTSGDLQKRRLQLEAILANIGTGVLVVDRETRITTLNSAAAKLLSVDAEKAVGKTLRESLPMEAEPFFELIEQVLAKGASGNQEMPVQEWLQWNLRSENGFQSIAAVATPLVENQGIWGVVAVLDDMTQLIKGQREMAWREVARRIAHEIKNPLTPIKLSAQRLQRRLGSRPGHEGLLVRECAETIIQNVDELKEMVNEFSSFARLPEVNPAPNQLNEMLAEVVTLYRQAHPSIEFQYAPEDRLPVFPFDRDPMKRVMINLFDNAVAALTGPEAPRHPKIRVETHYNDELKMAVIQTEDNGPGMADDVRERAFEPYFSTKSGGTGLGLAIVKSIVNDHDGFVRVHSTPGQGTRFQIELPTSGRPQYVPSA